MTAPTPRSSRVETRGALTLALALALAACSGGDTVGGLTPDEAERLNHAAEMLDRREARFENREVDETGYEEEPANEEGEAAEDEPAQD